MSVAHDGQGQRGQRRIQNIFFGCLEAAPSCDATKAQGVSTCSVTRLAVPRFSLVMCPAVALDSLDAQTPHLSHAPLTGMLWARLVSWTGRWLRVWLRPTLRALLNKVRTLQQSESQACPLRAPQMTCRRPLRLSIWKVLRPTREADREPQYTAHLPKDGSRTNCSALALTSEWESRLVPCASPALSIKCCLSC